MTYKQLIWDFDGTLFDTYPAMASAFREALAERGVTEPASQITSYMKISMGHAKAHYKSLFSLEDAFFERCNILRKEWEAKNARPFDGASDLCREICRNGGENYLFTHRGSSAREMMDCWGFTEFFSELVTAEQGFPRKPSPEAIRYFMEKHRFSPKDALMIGDRDLDMLSAKNAGIGSCFFADGGASFEGADFQIDQLADLFPILGLRQGF